ncbi:MAG: RuvX/YqgF family protein [Candidatus Paceibacterota bacterium]
MQTDKKRILGIDYGSKRVGVAISNEEGTIAFPLVVLENKPGLAFEVAKLVADNRAVRVVMGESRDYKGEPNRIYEDAKNLKEELEKAGCEVIFEPEFMTSVHAERFQGKNDKIDSSAAALILQSYLDRNKK